MKSLTSISTDSISILLPLYPYGSVLVSDTFLDEATNSFRLDFYMRQQVSSEIKG